jgi:hypothetical protein
VQEPKEPQAHKELPVPVLKVQLDHKEPQDPKVRQVVRELLVAKEQQVLKELLELMGLKEPPEVKELPVLGSKELRELLAQVPKVRRAHRVLPDLREPLEFKEPPVLRVQLALEYRGCKVFKDLLPST